MHVRLLFLEMKSTNVVIQNSWWVSILERFSEHQIPNWHIFRECWGAENCWCSLLKSWLFAFIPKPPACWLFLSSVRKYWAHYDQIKVILTVTSNILEGAGYHYTDLILYSKYWGFFPLVVVENLMLLSWLINFFHDEKCCLLVFCLVEENCLLSWLSSSLHPLFLELVSSFSEWCFCLCRTPSL